MEQLDIKNWLARLLVGSVVVMNIQSAIQFLAWPEIYRAGFELTGLPGTAAVRGFGVLFIMWNVPYIVALINPARHRLSMIEALVMQSIGLVGESFIYLTMRSEAIVLRSSIARFVLFDFIGLAFLAAAFLVSKPAAKPVEKVIK
jgi:hypothetical protein